jgi:hypothetical protein
VTGKSTARRRRLMRRIISIDGTPEHEIVRDVVVPSPGVA